MKSEKGVLVVIVISLIVLMNFVSGITVINEVETNPLGTDSGNEWIEIYSDVEVNLSGWYILDSGDDKHFFPNISIVNFYVLDSLTGLVNTNENLSLVKNNDLIIDNTGNFSDGNNDDNTWSRFPDVVGVFSFRDETKGGPNEVFVIQNKTSSPNCLIKGDSVKLDVQVAGFCLEEVKFSIYTLNGWENFSASLVQGSNYSLIIDSDNLEINNSVVWTVHASNCLENKTNGNETFYLNNRTNFSINPFTPDGLNNFYVSEPLITLDNGDASDIFYRWNGDSNKIYSSPFGLEDTPNNWEVTGGILDLHYFSEFSSCSEEDNTFSFLGDFQNPLVDDISPKNNSNVKTATPEISARLEELYGDNSGIDISSIVFRIDDVVEIPTIVSEGLDATLSFIPAPLGEGYHNVSIYVKDNAGRESELNWTFNVSFSVPLAFVNVSLVDGDVFDSNRIPFYINLNQETGSIEYKNLADSNPRFRRLCRNCDSYGVDRVRSIRLREGGNEITFRASRDGEVIEENVGVFVDSKKPRVSRILPKRNTYTNGSNFYIRYSEDNLENISLVINPEFTQICSSGKNQECFFNVDLSAFNNQSINFSFLLKDRIHNVSSKVTKIFVDTESPEIDLVMPINDSLVSKKVVFNISVSERVNLEYMDLDNAKPRWKRFCNNCDSYGNDKVKTKRFSKGEHTVIIRAVDKAGNSDEEIVSFEVL